MGHPAALTFVAQEKQMWKALGPASHLRKAACHTFPVGPPRPTLPPCPVIMESPGCSPSGFIG